MAVSHPIVVVIPTLYNCDIEWSGWLEVYLETAAPQDVRLVHHGRREEADLQPVSQSVSPCCTPSSPAQCGWWRDGCRHLLTVAVSATPPPPPQPPPPPPPPLHSPHPLLRLFPGASCTTSPVRCTLQPVQSPDLQRLERVGGVESKPVDLRLDDS